MKKTFILDTNVLLFDPGALSVFEDNDLIIPITVIEEIDRFKKDLNETGRNARLVSRKLDELRQQGSALLHNPEKLKDMLRLWWKERSDEDTARCERAARPLPLL